MTKLGSNLAAPRIVRRRGSDPKRRSLRKASANRVSRAPVVW